MEITYLGHSSFKLKGKQGVVVTDPFGSYVGFPMPSVSADIVTVSHQHEDHNAIAKVSGTSRREKPMVISQAGEYEVEGISLFGHKSFHDNKNGAERGPNIVFTIIVDGITIVHLGDLGHTLSDSFIEDLGTVDVLLCPVGGSLTVGPKEATSIIQEIEPSFVIPMHYKTAQHSEKVFGSLRSLEEFEKEYGVSAEPVKSFVVPATMPEQTTLVVLS